MLNFRSILLVDADPTQVAILNAYFRSLRVENITHASNGEEACTLVHENNEKFDLIVTDFRMSQRDWIAFLNGLRGEEYHGQMAIVSGQENQLLKNAEMLAREYGQEIIGKVRKPLTKASLDTVFFNVTHSSGSISPAQKQEINKDDILGGLEREEFIPYYQPKLDLLTGTIIGAEVLMRWESEGNRIITPDRFIALAEHQGLIDLITYRLFEHVVRDINARPHWSGLKFAINISPSMLTDTGLPDRICEIPVRAGLSVDCFHLEITETSFVDVDIQTAEVLSRLHMNGFELSVDDFGTGASTIEKLRQSPCGEVKIAQSLIRNMISDSFCAETVNARIALARELDIRIIAGGIENREVFDLVKSKGVDQAQGYFISRPKGASEIDPLFKGRNAWANIQFSKSGKDPMSKIA